MRRLPIVLLGALLPGACDDSPVGPMSGSLDVSTSITGDDPDTDGYQLTVDGEPVLKLSPTDSETLTLEPGRRLLDLLGVAPHCKVSPALPLRVDVPRQGRLPVDLQVDCPVTGAVVVVRSTGLDLDPNGYGIAVDGVRLSGTSANATTAVTRVAPGERTIGLTDISDNCAAQGPSSKTVTVVHGQLAPIGFEVRCTASTGVIRAILTITGDDVPGEYSLVVGTGAPRRFTPSTLFDFTGVPGGTHDLTLNAPVGCETRDGPSSVTITVGTDVRDIQEVAFSVVCKTPLATLRIHTTTSGTVNGDYDVFLWYGWYYYYGSVIGDIPPTGDLTVEVPPGTYFVSLAVPNRCEVTSFPEQFTVAADVTLDFSFVVECKD